jgi:hypothetical protein
LPLAGNISNDADVAAAAQSAVKTPAPPNAVVERRNGICCWDFGGSAEGNANEHEEEEDT